MKKDSFQTFKKLLKNTQKIIIVTHWSPDGDAIGSSLGLYHFLKQLKKTVSVIVPNSFPDFLNWMPGTEKIINFQEDNKKAIKLLNSAELIFTLDFNSFKRLEKLGDIVEAINAPKVLIDHHQEPDSYASYYFHDVKACSTCELIFDFIVGLGEIKKINQKIASCLYTGLMTDTGSFRYASVNSKTHFIISELLKTGILPHEIQSAVYDNFSLDRLKLVGYSLSEKLKIIEGYPIAYFCLTEKELKRYNFQKGDTEGIVNYPFSIKGIKICVLMCESDGYTKMSFRSKDNIDVNKFARTFFNGGGHLNAAGGKSDLSIKETELKFVELIKKII